MKLVIKGIEEAERRSSWLNTSKGTLMTLNTFGNY